MSAYEPVRYAALTDVGVKRSHNQDACAAQPAKDESAWQAHGHVFIVADGMGGHAVGEKASAKAVRDIPFVYAKHVNEGVVSAIRRAFLEANSSIYTIGQENPEFRGMGTTATALILRPEGAWIGHVGDSRAYRIRGDTIEQLTFDHSWVWEIARRQGMDPDELGDFKKNVIIRSLGPDPEVEVDIEGPHPLEPGDCFLLCSDGLSNLVTGPEIGAVVNTLSPEDAAKFLIELANLRGGPDNITVAIVQTGARLASQDRRPPSFLKRLWRAWNRNVPWPFSLLGLGSVLAIASLVTQLTTLFLIAALILLAGLVGLALFFRGSPSTILPIDDLSNRVLNIYKAYSCRITPELIEEMARLESHLLETMKAQEVPADWATYEKLAGQVEAVAAQGDLKSLFRARCASLGFLASCFNKSRQKEEVFRPSWTTP